jgi:hypothetical protein
MMAVLTLVNNARADRALTRSPIYHVIEDETVLTTTQAVTSSTINTGLAEAYGLDWDLDSATTPSVEIQILQSNDPNGPFVLWSQTSLTGYEFTSNATITTEEDGSDFELPPSRYSKVKVINRDSENVTITRMDFFNQ